MSLGFLRREVYTHFPISRSSAPHSQCRCAVSMGVEPCRHSHNHSWDPIAKRIQKPLLESFCAGVVGHFEVPNGEEELLSFKEHPGKRGQVELVQHPCDDGAQHLEGRGELMECLMGTKSTPPAIPQCCLRTHLVGEVCLAFFECPSFV